MNLAQIVSESAHRHPDQVAIKLDDAEVTYAALEQGAMRVAGLLRARGVKATDRVAIMMPNVPYFAVCYYGALRLGATVVPMNVLNKRREVTFYLEDSGAELLFVWTGFAEEGEGGAADAGCHCVVVAPGEFEKTLAAAEPFEAMTDRSESDTAVILYTSGTTGTPKGAELTHANLLRNCQISRNLFDLGTRAVTLGALPLFHSFGQTCGMNATLLGGGMLTLIPRFDPEKALEIIERDHVTVFEGVPTMYNAMLSVPDRQRFDTSSLEVCCSGGSAMPVELLKGFEEAFASKILEGYGLSETSPVASFNHPDKERKAGSIGTPVEGVEMKLVDDDGRDAAPGQAGEIVIRGHNVMKGYWKRPDATEEAIRDGWFHSGDIGQVDEDGYYFIVDRKKDMIIRGGFNIYPREIEEVLYEHPAVREAAVLGVPHDTHGEEVAAAVALKTGAEVTTDELRDFVKSHVAAYKYPRHIWFVDELPKGPTGKILKREIKPPFLA